jgi:heme-degrading monooxygenase HmoA
MPAQLVELDESAPFMAQLGDEDDGPVVLINKFTVPAADVMDDFVDAWAEAAAVMKGQPGFISTQLHKGTAESLTLVNVAEWESKSALRAALGKPEFQATHGKYPDGATSSPHVFRKVAVQGICGD